MRSATCIHWLEVINPPSPLSPWRNLSSLLHLRSLFSFTQRRCGPPVTNDRQIIPPESSSRPLSKPQAWERRDGEERGWSGVDVCDEAGAGGEVEPVVIARVLGIFAFSISILHCFNLI
ncbi:hypothetical protein C1H46_006276 [Malus baccata]|uniref:Uncharacterized protein n=1 Tax=Malus baccata TaxID=106549 RepID=A0A540NCD4_MALBA|nr:hypothetical protein C1H46_006276 [Malus baccata]